MRNYGINYDTGLSADGDCTRKRFDDAVVQRELQIIATDLHATAVRVSGDDPQRIARAGEHALAAGLELWFSPVPVNLEPGALPGYFARCAREAERLRRADEGRVVLMLGCEISLWCAGFLPGGDSVLGRIAAVTDPALQRKPDVMAALASGLERARHTLRDIVRAAREKFAGPLTYAAAPWETVDWELFDLVSVDAYRDADNAAGYRDALRAYRRFGKPVAVTEFGCCTYRGAADRGGMGWMIVDEKSGPPLIPGTYERDEEEQVRHLRDMLAIYETEDIDSAVWFTFAAFEQPRHHTDPHRDLDLASYGVVAVLEHERGTTYPDMGLGAKAGLRCARRRLRPRPAVTAGKPPPAVAAPASPDRQRALPAGRSATAMQSTTMMAPAQVPRDRGVSPRSTVRRQQKLCPAAETARQSRSSRCPLPGSVRDISSDDIGSVPVGAAAGSVVPHCGSRVSM